jgi:hypothetical protein
MTNTMQNATVSFGNNTMLPITHERVQALEGEALVHAFLQTAMDLQFEGVDQPADWDPKGSFLFLGLVWLKERAKELGIDIQQATAGPADLDNQMDHVREIFDPIKTWWVKDLFAA